jgi:arabinose-5-phosphate isomerase
MKVAGSRGKCYSTPVETSVASQGGKRTLDRERLQAVARNAMEIEAQSILAAAARLEQNLPRAVELITDHPGKVIVTGIGKSGLIARKIAATLRSTGTPAVFLHPAEAVHGDLGVCQQGDPVLMISKSGSTGELIELIPALRELQVSMIGILGNTQSPLAHEMDVVFDSSVQREADPGGFTPTSSSVVALALGHALAVALMEARGFTAEHFSRYHAGGQLGRNLRLRVKDVMHSGDEVAWVAPSDSLKHVVIAMSKRPLGAACVIGSGGVFGGLVTDGDVRRALQAHDDIRTLTASDVMTESPVAVGPDALVHEALGLMEDRPSQISVLPVVDPQTSTCVGLIRVHDIYHGRRAD